MNDQEFNEALHKFSEESVTHALHFRPSLERLMDTDHCQKLARIFHRTAKWERANAVDTLGSSLPDARGVYMFVWRPALVLPFEAGPPERFSWVLYVGKAGREGGNDDTIKNRYLREYGRFVGGDVTALWNRDPPRYREERLARYLTLRPLEYWFLLLNDPQDIHLLERKLILMLSPPLNTQGKGPHLTAGAPIPAFEETG
ncbi:MAG: hypothetical protein EXQ69_07120 [Acidimicrobiia bacterium]|nr:hypothetical protein [Acidimicrobiia bacterium]